MPLFAQIYFRDPAHEREFRRTHASNSGLNEEVLLRAQEAIHKCNPYVQQFKSAIEYVTQNDTANELTTVLTAHTRRCDLHRGTVNHWTEMLLSLLQEQLLLSNLGNWLSLFTSEEDDFKQSVLFIQRYSSSI